MKSAFLSTVCADCWTGMIDLNSWRLRRVWWLAGIYHGWTRPCRGGAHRLHGCVRWRPIWGIWAWRAWRLPGRWPNGHSNLFNSVHAVGQQTSDDNFPVQNCWNLRRKRLVWQTSARIIYWGHRARIPAPQGTYRFPRVFSRRSLHLMMINWWFMEYNNQLPTREQCALSQLISTAPHTAVRTKTMKSRPIFYRGLKNSAIVQHIAPVDRLVRFFILSFFVLTGGMKKKWNDEGKNWWNSRSRC